MNKEIVERFFVEYTGDYNLESLNNDFQTLNKECHFVLNDIYFPIAPLNITVQKENFNFNYKTLRTKASTKVSSGRGIINIQLRLLFNEEMFLMLHRLVIQIQNNPFVYVKNNYIYESIFGTKQEFYQKNLHCTVIGFRVSSFQAANNTFEAELDLRYFNYFPYSSNLLFKKDLENVVSIDSKNITSTIFSVFPFEIKENELKYNLKSIVYDRLSKEDSAQEKIISTTLTPEETIKKITNSSAVSNLFQLRSINAGDSAVFVRYYNYLQVKSLYENFGISLGFKGQEGFDQIELNEYQKQYLETGIYDKGNIRFVIGLHSKYMDFKIRAQITKLMLDKELSTKIYYNEYAYIQLGESVLKKYRQEILAGTEGIEDEKKRNSIIFQNQMKIKNWLTNSTPEETNQNYQYSNSYSGKEELLNRESILRLPGIENNERDIQYIRALDDFQIKNRNNISLTTFLFQDKFKYYPITNKGYERNGVKNRIYNEKVGSNSTASYGLFPVFFPFELGNLYSYDKENRALTISDLNDENNITLTPVTIVQIEGKDYYDNLKNDSSQIQKGDLLGFCEKEYLEIVINSGSYSSYETLYEESNYSENDSVLNRSYPELTSQYKNYGLKFLQPEDITAFESFNEYLKKASWFPYIEKEYMSNIFYKTKLFKIENSSFNIESKKLFEGDLSYSSIEISEMKSEALIGVAAGINNLTASIPILGQNYPTTQFLSSSEPYYNFNYVTKTRLGNTNEDLSGLPETILEFERIRSVLSKNAREYKFIPDAGFFLIDSLFTRLFGTFKESYIKPDNEVSYSSVSLLKPLVIDSFENRTLDSFPGASSFSMRLSETAVYNPEELREIKTNKTKDDSLFYKEIYNNVLENYCGKDGELILDTPPEKVIATTPITEDQTAGDWKYFDWKTKYFSYKDHYASENIEECKEFLKNNQGIDYMGYLVCKEFLDVIVDFYNWLSKEYNAPQTKIIITSGYDNPSKPGSRTTVSDHYFGSALDIKALGRNAQELHLIIELMYRLGIVQNPTKPGSKGNTLGGLGIYGKSILSGTNMSRSDASGGFVHIDLNVKKVNPNSGLTLEDLRNLPDSQRRSAVVKAFNEGKMMGVSLNPQDYAYNSLRRFSGYGSDKINGIIDPTPQMQYWNSTSHEQYKNSSFDMFTLGSVTQGKTKEVFFTELLNEFIKESLNYNDLPEVNEETELEDDTGSQKKSIKKRLNLEKNKEANREVGLLNPDAGWNPSKDDWESIIENKVKGLVWTSDFRFGEEILNASLYTENKDYENNLKNKIAAKLYNSSNGTITNDTLVKRFNITASLSSINDPNSTLELRDGESYNNILDIEAYLKQQGLTFVITDTSGNPVENLKDNKRLNQNFHIFVVDPGSGISADNVSQQYVKGELATLIDLICSFEKFASLLLIEPDMYLDEVNPISIQTEYKRIEDSLYGSKVVASYFSNLEFGVFGTLKYTTNNLDKFDCKKFKDIINKDKPDSFLNKQLGRDTSASRITTGVITVGFFIFEIVTVGTSIAAGGLSGGTAIPISLAILNFIPVAEEFVSLSLSSNDALEINPEALSGTSNLLRSSIFVFEDFKKRVNGYFNTQVYKDISDRQVNLFTEVYGNMKVASNIDFGKKTRENILYNSEGAESIIQSCRDIHETFMERNPIVMKYVDAAATLQSNGQISKLLSTDFVEGNSTIRKFSFLANNFDSGLGIDYLTHLLYYPKHKRFNALYFDLGNWQTFNEVDFDDLFKWENDGIIFEQSSYDFDRGVNQNKFYSIDEQAKKNEAQNKAISASSLFDFSKVADDKIGNNRFIYSIRDKLKSEQDKRIAYLKTILEEAIKGLYSYPEFKETISNVVGGFEEEFDFSGSNAYPDIDLPMDPFNPDSNVNVNPGFFYLESQYENNINLIKDKVKTRSQNIMQTSLGFVKDLRDGLFLGEKSIIESQENNLIKDFIIKDQQEGSNDIEHIIEGNTADPKKIMKDIISVNEDLQILLTNATEQQSNEKSNSTTNLNNDDTLSAETAIEENLNNLNSIENPAEHLNKIKDQIKTKIEGTIEAFGSNLGFNRENLASLNLYNAAQSNKDLNKYLGLFGDNSNYLDDNNIKQTLEKSGENLLKKQHDMKRAYPTFKFYLIEEDANDSDNLFVFDDFYSFNSVKDFTVYKSRKLAADTAVIRLQNVSGTLDGSKIGLLRDIDYDIAQRKEKNSIGQQGSYEKVESVVLRPGVSCQLRAGYNSNPKDLTILLSGKIADVAWSSNGDMCEITVQSFGVELETKRYGMSKEDPISMINFNTTHKLLAYLLFKSELKHFGRFKKNRRFQTGESKSVVIAKDNYLGNTQGLSYGESLMSYAGTASFAFIIFAVASSVFKVRWLRSIGQSDEALKVLDDAGVAAKKGADAFSDASAAAKTLNVAGAEAAVGTVISEAGIFGKLLNFVFRRGWGRGTKLADDVLDKVDALSTRNSFANLNSINTTLTAPAANSRFYNFFLNTINFFTGIVTNVSKGGKLIDVLDNVGDATALLRKLSTLNASTTAVVARSFAQKSWIGAYFSAVTNGLTLGVWGSVKLQATAFLLGKTAEYLLNALSATFTGVYEVLKNLVLDAFTPSLDQIILSPQDDSLYCPHPDKYIKPKKYGAWAYLKREFSNIITTVGTLLYNNSIGMFDNPDSVNQTNLLKLRSLMMDRRLNASNGENVYNISGNTIWEVFHEMSLRHPGWVYGARQYGNALEYRMYFGLPSQRYFAHPITPSKAVRLNSIYEIAQTDRNLSLEEMSTLIGQSKLDSIYTSFDKLSDKDRESAVQAYCKALLFKEWELTTNKRFIPFRNFHLISSDYNIVANNINGINDIINEIGVMYNEAEPDKEPQWVIRTLRAHQDIPEEQIHSKPIRYPNLKGSAAALRYGIAELANSAKEMYKGEIIILGNPDINPYDVCILDDKCNEMFGPVEVEAVTHMFNFETGFLTEIKPNALVTANEGVTFPMLNSVIMYDIGMKIAQNEHYSLRFDSKKFDEKIDDYLDDWLSNVDLFQFPIYDKASINTTISEEASSLLSTGRSVEGAIANNLNKDLLKTQIKNMFTGGQAIFQSELLNPNANVDGIVNTSGTTTLLASITGITAASAKSFKNPTALFFAGLTALSFAAKETLNYQLKTPGTFISNSLFTGDMLVSPVTDGNLIQVYPLFKNNKPMVYGGYEKLSLKNNIANKLGNIYNTLSDAAYSINSMIMEYSNPNAILNDNSNISVGRSFAVNALETLLPFNLPAGTVKGYYTSYKNADLETVISQTNQQ